MESYLHPSSGGRGESNAGSVVPFKGGGGGGGIEGGIEGGGIEGGENPMEGQLHALSGGGGSRGRSESSGGLFTRFKRRMGGMRIQWRVICPLQMGDGVGGWGRESNEGTVARFKRGEGWGRGIQWRVSCTLQAGGGVGEGDSMEGQLHASEPPFSYGVYAA